MAFAKEGQYLVYSLQRILRVAFFGVNFDESTDAFICQCGIVAFEPSSELLVIVEERQRVEDLLLVVGKVAEAVFDLAPRGA